MDSSLGTCQPITPAKRAFAHDSADDSATSQLQTQGPLHKTTVRVPTSPRSIVSIHSPKATTLLNRISRQVSPALSSGSSLSALSSTTPPPFGLDGTVQSAEQGIPAVSARLSDPHPVVKRRKLTVAEKEQRRIEKEHRRIEKEQKEQERAKQKAKKEEEKRKAEEEMEKKERTQKRINSFFAQPKESSNASIEARKHASDACATSNRLGDASCNDLEVKSDYRRTFLPFAIPSNTTCAPWNLFTWDAAATKYVQDSLDQNQEFKQDCSMNLDQSLALCPTDRRPRGIRYDTVKDIIRRLVNPESNSIDLSTTQPVNPLQILQKVPMRYIHFDEDIRPPYIGTYTKIDMSNLNCAGRNPFKKLRPDTDYDYDSEAEWEEPEDGEDLLSEGDSELESNDGADDMTDFLDDEEADNQILKKRIVIGDLEPICSGLCWEDGRGAPLNSNGKSVESSHGKLTLLQSSLQLPIDPFSSLYWQKENDVRSAPLQLGSGMQPPRQPLKVRPNISVNGLAVSTLNSGSSLDAKPKNTSTKPTRLLVGSELEEFKQAVADSEHTKIGLLAILKKQFPKVPKTVLTDTLNSCAERQGRSESEKRWRIRGI